MKRWEELEEKGVAREEKELCRETAARLDWESARDNEGSCAPGISG